MNEEQVRILMSVSTLGAGSVTRGDVRFAQAIIHAFCRKEGLQVSRCEQRAIATAMMARNPDDLFGSEIDHWMRELSLDQLRRFLEGVAEVDRVVDSDEIPGCEVDPWLCL